MTRPLTITSPLHPMVITSYLLASTAGLAHLLGIAEAKALTAWIGGPLAGAWALVITVAPLLAIFGAVVIARGNVELGLRSEGVAALATGLVAGLYVAGIIHGYGLTVPVTLIYGLNFTVGPLARAGQAWYELRRVARGRAHPVVADPPPLGDPDDRR